MAQFGESQAEIEVFGAVMSGRAFQELAAMGLLPQAPGAAERLARYRGLLERAREVFGDELKASRWLSLPSPDLAGRVPLQVAAEDGYSSCKIEAILSRFEHGIDF